MKDEIGLSSKELEAIIHQGAKDKVVRDAHIEAIKEDRFMSVTSKGARGIRRIIEARHFRAKEELEKVSKDRSYQYISRHEEHIVMNSLFTILEEIESGGLSLEEAVITSRYGSNSQEHRDWRNK